MGAPGEHEHDVVVIGPAGRPRASWRSRLAPSVAAIAMAVIGIGVAALLPTGGHHSHALPPGVVTPTGQATPAPLPARVTLPATRSVMQPTTQPATPSSPTDDPATGSPPARGPSVTRTRGSTAGTPGTPAPSSTPPPPSKTEEAYNKNGVPTFADYANASNPGGIIAFGRLVQVSCKIYDPSIPSASPDGYWYRIASAPWDDKYYAVANTFLNGDPPGGPYSHHVDPAVPEC
jgi:hypothetical protein